MLRSSGLSGFPLEKVYHEYPVSSLMDRLVCYWPMNDQAGDRRDTFGRCSFVLRSGKADRVVGPFSNSYSVALRLNKYSLQTDETYYWTRGDKDFCYAIWIMLLSNNVPTKGQISQIILNRDTSDILNRDYEISYIITTGNFRFKFFVEPSILQVQTAISLNTWYLVWCWHDLQKKTFSMQLNNGGVSDLDYTSFGVKTSKDLPLILGDGSTSINSADANIGPIALWHRLLTQAEKDAYYNSGNGMFPPFLGVP